MGSKITIKDIAAEAGVSISLVSFVMSNQATGRDTYRVNKDTAKRIMEVAKKHNYRPNTMARFLRSGRSYSIGVIVSDISNEFFSQIARCIEDRATTYNYSVLFGSMDENPEKLKGLVEVFINKGIDGLIIAPCQGAEEAIRKVLETNIPVVLLDRDIPTMNLDCVVINNINAAKEATEALIARGCQKIEMVSHTMRVSNLIEREAGYMAAMEQKTHLKEMTNVHRLPHDELEGLADYIREAAEEGVEGLLFATNTLAIAALKEIHRQGLSVPEDFMIASFDSNDIFDLGMVDVAYVKQPIEQFGRESVDLMMKRIERGCDNKTKTQITLIHEITQTRNQAIECFKDYN